MEQKSVYNLGKNCKEILLLAKMYSSLNTKLIGNLRPRSKITNQKVEEIKQHQLAILKNPNNQRIIFNRTKRLLKQSISQIKMILYLINLVISSIQRTKVRKIARDKKISSSTKMFLTKILTIKSQDKMIPNNLK